MADQTYDIQQLVNESGVPRRTIYFYVQQGLLPPPNGAGLAAHYTTDHLLRLQLIPVLRDQGLRLDEIRARFSQMDSDAMRQLYESANRTSPHLSPAPVPVRSIDPPAPNGGWSEQQFTHYTFPGGITLTAPQTLNPLERQRLDQLLQAARRIYLGWPQPPLMAKASPSDSDSNAGPSNDQTQSA